MKAVLLTIILFLSVNFVNAQDFVIKAKVDRRIELTSIIARLAEYNEYVRDDFKIYAEDADKHFAGYKNHPAVEFARKIRMSNDIGFDAVPSLAVHLNQNLTPKFPFSDSAPDKRWGKENAVEFAKLLGQFYRDTDAENFFKSHGELYKLAEERFQKVVDKVDFKWYKTFYGEVPKGTFNIYIGLLNGGMNFGPKVVYPDGKEELYAVIGTWKMDDESLPVYTDDFLPTIIHEFNHSFINSLVDSNAKLFQTGGEKIFYPVTEKMQRLAYGNWKTMIVESLVRAAVTRYLFEHDGMEKADSAIIVEKAKGFVWMDELFVLLGTYENNRKSYATFRSFMPVLAGYYVDLSKRIDNKLAVFRDQQPKVVAIDAFKNEAQDVDPNIEQITFTFDKPLNGKGYSINFGKSGQAGYPEIGKKVGFYSEDGLKFTLLVKLKPDWEYEFVITGNGFFSKDGYPLQDYVVKFRTKKM